MSFFGWAFSYITSLIFMADAYADISALQDALIDRSFIRNFPPIRYVPLTHAVNLFVILP
jgi:hypothetical protein